MKLTLADLLALVALLSIQCFAAASEATKDGCCWCGKRFVPKPGMWEGFGASTLQNADENAVAPEKPVFVAFPSKSFYFDAEPASIILRCMWQGCGHGLAKQAAEGHTFTLTAYSRESTLLAVPIQMDGSNEISVSFDSSLLVPQAQTDVHIVVSQTNIPAPLHQQTLFFSRVSSAPAGSVRVDFSRGLIETPIASNLVQKGGKRRWKGILKPIAAPREMAPYFPYGFFINWGGWLGKNATLLKHTIGNTVHPISPFSPGGLDAVQRYLDLCWGLGVRWHFDLQHVYRNHTLLAEQVTRFRSHPALLGWYLADEPDGAGTFEGVPVGVPPSEVREAYAVVKRLDPFHPVSLSLNCRDSAAFYADGADILLVDPYPVSISPAPCTATHGCCGCDGCAGVVTDVADRVDTVRRTVGRAALVWVVGQAFGAEGHWRRVPTRAELRVMSYLAAMRGASGVLHFLRESTVSALLVEAGHVGKELLYLQQLGLWGGTDAREGGVAEEGRGREKETCVEGKANGACSSSSSSPVESATAVGSQAASRRVVRLQVQVKRRGRSKKQDGSQPEAMLKHLHVQAFCVSNPRGGRYKSDIYLTVVHSGGGGTMSDELPDQAGVEQQQQQRKLGLAALWKQDNPGTGDAANKRARFSVFIPQIANVSRRLMKPLFAGHGQNRSESKKGKGDLLLDAGHLPRVAIRPMATRVYKTRSEKDECGRLLQ